MNLAGRTPNGQEFVASPRQVWLVKSSQAIIRGADAGPEGPLAEQRDFLIPQRGRGGAVVLGDCPLCVFFTYVVLIDFWQRRGAGILPASPHYCGLFWLPGKKASKDAGLPPRWRPHALAADSQFLIAQRG